MGQRVPTPRFFGLVCSVLGESERGKRRQQQRLPINGKGRGRSSIRRGWHDGVQGATRGLSGALLWATSVWRTGCQQICNLPNSMALPLSRPSRIAIFQSYAQHRPTPSHKLGYSSLLSSISPNSASIPSCIITALRRLVYIFHLFRLSSAVPVIHKSPSNPCATVSGPRPTIHRGRGSSVLSGGGDDVGLHGGGLRPLLGHKPIHKPDSNPSPRLVAPDHRPQASIGLVDRDPGEPPASPDVLLGRSCLLKLVPGFDAVKTSSEPRNCRKRSSGRERKQDPGILGPSLGCIHNTTLRENRKRSAQLEFSQCAVYIRLEVKMARQTNSHTFQCLIPIRRRASPSSTLKSPSPEGLSL